MARPIILAYLGIEELKPVVQQLAGMKDVECQISVYGDHLTQQFDSFQPFIMIVDFTGIENQWLFRHVSEIVNEHPSFPVVAIAPSLEEGMKHRLAKAGCKIVFGVKEFPEKISDVVDRALRLEL